MLLALEAKVGFEQVLAGVFFAETVHSLSEFEEIVTVARFHLERLGDDGIREVAVAKQIEVADAALLFFCAAARFGNAAEAQLMAEVEAEAAVRLAQTSSRKAAGEIVLGEVDLVGRIDQIER